MTQRLVNDSPEDQKKFLAIFGYTEAHQIGNVNLQPVGLKHALTITEIWEPAKNPDYKERTEFPTQIIMESKGRSLTSEPEAQPETYAHFYQMTRFITVEEYEAVVAYETSQGRQPDITDVRVKGETPAIGDIFPALKKDAAND